MRFRLWDLPTRLFHWTLVILLAVSWYTGENEIMGIHFYAGYAIFTLLLFRLFWGLWGSTTARFASFIKGPGAVIAYLRTLPRRQPSRSLGHNPLGALSVLAMLAAIAAQVAFGLVAIDIDFVDMGPLSDLVAYETASAALDYHALTVNIIIALVVLHVAVIVFYLIYKRENLTGQMLHGRLSLEDGDTDKQERAKALGFRGPLAAVLTLAAAAGIVWFTVTVLPKIL